MNPTLTNMLTQAAGGPELTQQKQDNVSNASMTKQLDFQSIATARATGKGSESSYGLQWDLENLSPLDLQYKYGNEGTQLMQQIAEGSRENARDASLISHRLGGQTLWDSGTGALAGFAGGLGGLAALGTGLVNDEAGAYVGDKVQQGMNWVEKQQSDAVNAARRQQRIKTSLDVRDNAAQEQKEISEGSSEFMAGLRRFGRDAVDTIGNSADDPTMLGQGTSEAIGSLVAGGPLSKGLKLLGRAAVGAARTGGLGFGATRVGLRAVEGAGWPLATVGLESGGAYSGSVSEVMQMDQKVLEQSPLYQELIKENLTPEQARSRIANDAGLRAALYTAPVALATSYLSKWAEAPFKARPLTEGVVNTLAKEPTEEFIQSGFGQLAQNLGIQQTADPTQDILEGVGEQAGQGALYGLTAAGTVQAPGTAVGTAQGVYKGVTKAAGTLVNAISQNYAKRVEELEKASPVSNENTVKAADAVQEQLPQLIERFNLQIDASDKPEAQRNSEKQFVSALNKAWNIQPDEVESHPQSVKDLVAGTSNRFAALIQLGRSIAKMEPGSEEQLSALAAQQELMEPLREVEVPDLQILDALPEGREKNNLNVIRNVLTLAQNNPAAKRAEKVIDGLTKEGVVAVTPEQVSDEAINTPEGMQAAKNAAALLTARPGTGSLQTAETIQKHARSGKLRLSAAQQRAVDASVVILKAAEAISAAKTKNLKPWDVVNKEIISEERDPASRDPSAKRSAREHINDILSALTSRDIENAKILLQDFGHFAQHMQNKLEAHNQYYGMGKSAPKSIGFTSLNPTRTLDDSNPWFQSKPSVFVVPTNESSVRHAQNVATEAGVLADIFNGLVDALPQLGVQKVEKASLDPALSGDIADVVNFHKNHPVESKPATQEQKTQPQPQPKVEETIDDKSKGKEEVQSTGTTEGKAERVDSGTETQPKESGTRPELKVERTPEKITPEMQENADEAEEALQEEASKKIEESPKLTLEERRARNKERNQEQQTRDLLQARADEAKDSITGEFADTDQVLATLSDGSKALLVHTRNGDQDTITATVDGEQIGSLTYEPSTDVALDTQVEPEARKLGVARAMYRFAAEKGNYLLGTNAKNGIAHSFTEEGRAMRSRMDITKAELSPVEEAVDTALTPEQQALVDKANALIANSVESKFPNLVLKGENSLSGSHNLNQENSSRLSNEEVPADFVVDALSSNDNFLEVVGKSDRQITKEIAKGYRQLLSEGSAKVRNNLGGILNAMRSSLDTFLNKNQNREKIKTAISYVNGKALAIVDNVDGEYAYNETLLQSAALAGIQWMLTSRNSSIPKEDSDYEAMTGVESASEIPYSIKQRLDAGSSVDEVKLAIASKIREYWGLSPKSSAYDSYAKGIAEAVAAEVMDALVKTGFISIDAVKMTEEEGLPPGTNKTFNRYSVNQGQYPQEVRGFPSAIDKVALKNPKPTRYIGNEIPEVEDTQMNNGSVKNTKSQKRTLRNANKTPHRLNLPVVQAYMALGKEGVVALFGGRKSTWTKLDKEHADSIEGKELNLRNAFDEIMGMALEMNNYAQSAGKNLRDTVIRFAYNMSKVGRMQMLGAYTSQGNKLTREAVLPTWSTLDLVDNQKHSNAFYLAIAQHLGSKFNGRKVGKISTAEAVQAGQADLQGKFAPLVQYLRDWVKGKDLQTLPEQEGGLDVAKIQELLGDNALNEAGFHSLLEYARFMESTPEQRKSFETPLYLEADGVTNGPIMAMMMLTFGTFNSRWLQNVSKGGVSFGTSKSMHQLDQVDLYKTAVTNMMGFRQQMLSKIQSMRANPRLKEDIQSHIKDLTLVMSTLLGDDVKYDPDTQEITFERGVAKNPLTITLYGSSPYGIAGNFASQLKDALAEQRTEIDSRMEADPSLTPADIVTGGNQERWKAFQNALDNLSMSYVGRDQVEDTYYLSPAPEGRNSYTRSMTSNLLTLFVEPMIKGIENTVGESLMKSMRLIRQATQVQSIFLEAAFKQEIQRAIEEKKKDPFYKKHDFLSEKDRRDIERRLEEKFPNIVTNAQVFRIAKSQRNFDENVRYSDALNGGHETKASNYAPVNAGVSGIASLVIGFGDGYMVQVGLQDSALQNVLAVFDGINMPLDKLSESGMAANEAAYKAFMNNPMNAVHQAFSQFRSQVSTKNMSEKTLKDLARAFQEEGKEMPSTIDVTSEIDTWMESLEKRLAWVAKSIEARHRAMQDFGMSVDHMASASAPFHNGVEGLDLPQEEQLRLLNERYNHYMETLVPQVKLRVVKEPNTEGLVFYTMGNLQSLAQSYGLTKDQQQIFDEIMKTDFLKDYKIITGSLEDIVRYRTERGLPVEDLDSNTNGFITSGNEIYMVNPSGEVLTHEMVHAATFQAVLAVYQGKLNDPIAKGAVERLESMMHEFMDMEIDPALPVEVQNAIEDARETINNYTDQILQDEPAAMANAVNEFMAWSLTNQDIMDFLKVKKVPKFVEWTQKVLKSIKEVLFGKSSVRLGKDFLSQIRFNSRVLLNIQPSLVQGFERGTQFHSTEQKTRLNAVRDSFRDLVLNQMKQVDQLDAEKVSNSLAKYMTEVGELSKHLSAAFGLSSIESSTLESVVSALGTQAQLDSNVMGRMQKLYNHFQDTVSIENFMEKNPEWANTRFNLLMGKGDRRTDPYGRTSLLPVFIGLSLVSEDFQEILGKIPVPKTFKGKDTFDNMVGNMGHTAMDELSSLLVGDAKAQNLKQAMSSLMDRLQRSITNEQSNLDLIEQSVDKGSLSLNQWMKEGLTKLSDIALKKGEELSSKTSRMEKTTGNVLKLAAGLASEKNADQVAEGVLGTAERIGLNNGMLNLVKDLIGRTNSTAAVYDLIKPIRTMVQQIRQQFRESVPQVITEAFKNAPTKEQFATMFRSMGKTDLPALLGSMNRQQILELFSDSTKLDQSILDLEEKLRSLDPKHFGILKKKMQQLAHFMNTKEPGTNLLRNANAVAHLFDENKSSTRKAVTEEMISTVDQLVSLYAIENLSKDDRSSMASLVQNEPKGMDFVLAYMEGQHKTESRKAKQGMAVYNHYKGHMWSLPTKQGHLRIANNMDYESLREQGYSYVGEYKGSDVHYSGQSKGYYYTDLPARTAFAQGMIQNVDQTAYGVDPVTGFSHDLMAGRITGKRIVAQLVDAMKTEKTKKENLLPVRNHKGQVIAFEQSMDPEQIKKLDLSEQMHEMLGVWRGRQVEERQSVQMNKTLIDALHDNWEENKNDTPELYVNLLDASVLDNVQRDAVSLFSDEVREYIEKKFGKRTFMVRKSLLDDVTGYRQPSVTDFWTNNNRRQEQTNEAVKQVLISTLGPNAYRIVLKAEQIIQGIVSDARTTIVVKSMVVPAINIVSNVYQLAARGVNPIQIARETPQAINQLNMYLETRLEQIRIEAQLRAVGDDKQKEARLRAKIRSITDSHQRMAIWPLIEAGEFSTISDVGLSREDLSLTSGKFNQWLEQKVDQLPEGLKTAAKYGMLSKDTALFQGLQKSVQYGDFIAKAILYNHLTKKEKMTREQALAIITEEFVNYDRLPGRSRAYLENMGVLWFFNYKLRSVKVALSMLRNNPLHALIGSVLPMPVGVGTPLDESIVNKALEGTLGYSIGPGMALRAPFLNPWVNVVH